MRPGLAPSLLASLLLAACAAACATPRQAGTGGTCPGSQELCLTGLECTFDRARGCELCMCRAADRTLEPLPGQAGARPEDRREPALPPLR
jgi:hypothetical protein